MTQGGFSVMIAAPPELVWRWISQLEKHLEWSSKPHSRMAKLKTTVEATT